MERQGEREISFGQTDIGKIGDTMRHHVPDFPRVSSLEWGKNPGNEMGVTR